MEVSISLLPFVLRNIETIWLTQIMIIAIAVTIIKSNYQKKLTSNMKKRDSLTIMPIVKILQIIIINQIDLHLLHRSLKAARI